ncbi:MAG: hypothetical protein NC200_07735, partial [Candidatus Gastranaerophilales bacterium]|nr:hypothetical protein [Candidatus Gastranaerophilales bacterium]
MIKSNPSQKPLISRLGRFGITRPCEFNKPSNAFKWFTGQTPISIGEDSLHLTMKNSRDKVLEILEKLGNLSPKDYSFIALSGIVPSRHNANKKFHCLTVTNVDNQKETLDIVNKRTNLTINITFNDLIEKFKGFVGMIHN